MFGPDSGHLDNEKIEQLFFAVYFRARICSFSHLVKFWSQTNAFYKLIY